MSEYDDVCNEVVGDLAVVIYHREQEIEKLKKDNNTLYEALYDLDKSYNGISNSARSRAWTNVERVLKEFRRDGKKLV